MSERTRKTKFKRKRYSRAGRRAGRSSAGGAELVRLARGSRREIRANKAVLEVLADVRDRTHGEKSK
jgi:hypothetical protein